MYLRSDEANIGKVNGVAQGGQRYRVAYPLTPPRPRDRGLEQERDNRASVNHFLLDGLPAQVALARVHGVQCSLDQLVDLCIVKLAAVRGATPAIRLK